MDDENKLSEDSNLKANIQYYKGKLAKPGKLNRATNFSKIKDDVRQKLLQVPFEQERRRRVVEIDYLADQLFCKIYTCQAKLDLRKIHRETLQGMASIFYIYCDQCGKENDVHTCRRSTTLPEYHDVNLKITVGTLDAGMGAMHLNKLLSAANLPTFEETTFKRHERVVSPFLQEAVHESCVSAAQEERKLTGPSGKIRAAADMGWQRRNSGFKYDSLTGHSSLIGEKSGKVMAVQVMTATCRACKIAGAYCGKATCKRNHDGSAKSMEAAAAVLMLKSPTLVEAGVTVDTLIGDADSSTAAAVRGEFGDKVERALDLVHTQKVLKNDLYKLQKTHKVLDKGVIAYLVATVGTVVKKNSGNVESMKKQLLNIPEHVFDQHNYCDIEWCSYLQKARQGENSESYRSKYFNKNLGVHGGDLYCSIKACIEKIVKKSDQLAVFGSTQACESFNNIVGSKAPKIRHYGDTESLSNRVFCAALQKNEGVEYVSTVMNKIHLSPGNLTVKFRKKLQQKRLYQAKRAKLTHIKAKRKLMLQRRGVTNRRKEVAEGTTYRSGIAFEEEGPTPLKAPTSKCIVWKNETPSSLPPLKLRQYRLTFFDVETGGFNDEKDDLLQISAEDQNSSFSVYCLPTKPIPTAASQVTMLTSRKGELLHKGVPVPAVPLEDALRGFLAYLKKKKQRVLAAHNASFDVRFLYSKFKKFELLTEATFAIKGYIDTLKLARKKFKNATTTPSDMKLSTLVEHELGAHFTFEAHNSVEDVRALRNLVEKWAMSKEEVNSCGHSFTDYVNLKERCETGAELDALAVSCGLNSKELKRFVRIGYSLNKLITLCQSNSVEEFIQILKPISDETALRMYQELGGKTRAQSTTLPQQTTASNCHPQVTATNHIAVPQSCKEVITTAAADTGRRGQPEATKSRPPRIALTSKSTGSESGQLLIKKKRDLVLIDRPRREIKKPRKMDDFCMDEELQ